MSAFVTPIESLPCNNFLRYLASWQAPTELCLLNGTEVLRAQKFVLVLSLG